MRTEQLTKCFELLKLLDCLSFRALLRCLTFDEEARSVLRRGV